METEEPTFNIMDVVGEKYAFATMKDGLKAYAEAGLAEYFTSDNYHTIRTASEIKIGS